MTDDQLRIEQVRALHDYGDDDAAEIALAEILTSGPPTMPLEELVPYLLSDLTENDNQ